MKKSQIISIVITTVFVFIVLIGVGQTDNTDAVPIDTGTRSGSNDTVKVLIALYYSGNIFCIAAIGVRYLLIKGNEHFKKQSKVKNIFIRIKYLVSVVGYS